MRLTVVHNGLKRTISASGRFGLLQTVSESNTELCVNEDAVPPRGLDCEIPHQLEKGTEHFL